MLIEEYIKNLTAFDVTDGAIANILVDAGVAAGSDISSLTVKQMDLCKGYTYIWCATVPTTSGSVEDADNGWSHREGGKQVAASDKRLLRRMGLDLLAQYGINPIKSSIRVMPRGMRLFPRRK